MKLLSNIEIDHFRSIALGDIDDLGNLTSFAGLNNSGKSNVLRALNAFFTGFTDPDVRLNVDQDYYRPDLRKKKKKTIKVGVTFDLPAAFRFRKGLESSQKLLGGTKFKITKEWVRGSRIPLYYLNGTELGIEDRDRIEQFLGLISFRYIPNRVMPLSIIRAEHQALRDVLVRRLAKKAKNQQEVFGAIRDTSATLIKKLAANVHDASPDIGSIRLATPTSWQDMVFAFGYKLGHGDFEIDDSSQGSGIQSLLMLETLSLIDRDYFQKFGWRQAAVWALEEPESSLHSLLEAKVSSYLSSISADSGSRLQILCTTHSDLVLQHSDKTVFVCSGSNGSIMEKASKELVLKKAAKLGISRWVHPILSYPTSPVVIAEGKYDCAFIERAIHLLAPNSRIKVTYLEALEPDSQMSGGTEVFRYIKASLPAIRTRIPSAPILVILDWDAKGKQDSYLKIADGAQELKVLVWPEETFNTRLNDSFKGIERHMSDRIVNDADSIARVCGQTADGGLTVAVSEYPGFKKAAYEVVEKGIEIADIAFARPFIQTIIDTCDFPGGDG
jgi:energy-coupling factor transporter ATP-binding protein EcfA2